MPVKVSNVALQHQFSALPSTFTRKSSSLRSPEGLSLISIAISLRLPLRAMIGTDAPSDQMTLPSLTKFPVSSAKNQGHKRRAKLKLLDARKFSTARDQAGRMSRKDCKQRRAVSSSENRLPSCSSR